MIEELNYLLRVIALGSGLMLLALVAANDMRRELKLPLAGAIIGFLTYLVNAAPLTAPTGPLRPYLDLVAISAMPFVWLFARNLLDRPPERRLVLIVSAVMVSAWVVRNFVPATWPVGLSLAHMISFALVADLVKIAISGREKDAFDQNRTLRVWLPLLLAALAVSMLTVELAQTITPFVSLSLVPQLVVTVLIIVLILTAGLALFRTDPGLLHAPQGVSKADDETAPVESAHDPAD